MTTTSCTSTSLARAVHRRRLIAAVLALPLSLAMTGTALAVGSSDRGPAESASVRVAADAAPGQSAKDDAKGNNKNDEKGMFTDEDGYEEAERKFDTDAV